MSIEMRGKEEELKEYFKGIDKVRKPLKITDYQRKILLIIIVLMIGFLIIGFVLNTILDNINHKNYLTEGECNQKINDALNNMGIPWYQQLFNFIIPYLPLLLIAIAAGWVLHGVGFRII